MTCLRPVRAREVIRFLDNLGFAQVRQKVSHRFFLRPDGRTATVPDHRGEDFGHGILAKMLRDTERSPPEFLTWLSR